MTTPVSILPRAAFVDGVFVTRLRKCWQECDRTEPVNIAIARAMMLFVHLKGLK